MVDITIREMEVEDAEDIADILNDVIAHGGLTVLDGPFTVEQEEEFLENFPDTGIFYVAVDEDENVIGFQTLERFAPYTSAFDHVGIIGTFINLSYRRQGIGTALADKTFETAKERGYEKIFTYVRADNDESLEFHTKKLGFTIVGTAVRQAKLEDKYIDEIIIEKFL